MNTDRIIVLSDMITGLVNALETALIEAHPDGTGTPAGETLFALFYVLMEKTEEMHNHISELAGHIKVCDAIAAVNHVKELEAENERLKKALAEVKTDDD